MNTTIDNLSGEIFSLDGRVAISVPAMGHPDAIKFKVGKVHPAQGEAPAWADVMVGDLPVRINPDIIQGTAYHRFADCLSVAYHNHNQLTERPVALDLPPKPHPHSEQFVFWIKTLGTVNPTRVVMVDTYNRLKAHTVSVNDGQNRNKDT